ncbi:ABC transporter permease subunit [Anaerosporobacter faecicola]|uniref:ABC transporter permease subunit n=1 Tax=Anaerosporobacter faecicola TaxID=2718714 RepID=UPI00143B1232|nr:ABC transporter permease subunit [Anaerosporobacter faecicola]
MRKLLRANFARLKKSTVFWVCMIVMFLLGIVLPLVHYSDKIQSHYEVPLDNGFFSYAIFVVILASVFTSLYIGTEYSDGTIRNKIIIGQKRVKIYLSNLIICICAGVFFCIAHLIPYLCIGIPLLGFFESGILPILLFMFSILIMMTAFIALFTLLSMLVQSKAISAVICLLTTFCLLLFGSFIFARLSEPEYYEGYSYTQNGITTTQEQEKNSLYLEGTKREIFQFLLDFTPGGQVIQLSGMETGHPEVLICYSLILIITTTGIGIPVFQKKDLK